MWSWHKDIHLCEIHRIVKFIETESKMVIPGAGGVRREGESGQKNEKLLFNRYSISVLEDEKSFRDGWW